MNPTSLPSCDCPRTRHNHGSRDMYLVHGCRCTPCRQDTREYTQSARTLRALGKFNNHRMDPGPVRDHIRMLKRHRMTAEQIANLSGVSRNCVDVICTGKSRATGKRLKYVFEPTYKAIMAVQPTDYMVRPGNSKVPAIGTRRRLQALMACGYSVQNIANHFGVRKRTVQTYMERELVNVATARKVRDLYDQLWNVPPPEDTPVQAQVASRLRNLAAKHGWQPPMAWDDDRIDDPSYHPTGIRS